MEEVNLRVLPEKLGGVCGPLPKTLTLFMTIICDIPYPICDLTKNSKPIEYMTLKSIPCFSSLVETNVKLPLT